MDPLGLLLEIVALTVYPGGLFLALLTWITYRGAGLTPGSVLDARGMAAVAAATVAAAMVPMPGTPAASLPPSGGATANLAAAVLLVFVAGSLVAPHPWSVRRRGLIALTGIGLFLLGLMATSLSITTISGSTSAADVAARVLAAVGVLVALPLVMQPQVADGHRVARGIVIAATLELVFSLLIPPALQWPAGPLAVVATVIAVGLYALLLRGVRAATRREHLSLVALAGMCSVAASVAAVIAARP
jgi:hypothetical protein